MFSIPLVSWLYYNSSKKYVCLTTFACWFWHPVFKCSQGEVYKNALSFYILFKDGCYLFLKLVNSISVPFSVNWSHSKGKNRAVGKSLESVKQRVLFFVSSRTETKQHNFRKKWCYWLLERKYPRTQGQFTEQTLSLQQWEEEGEMEADTGGKVFLKKWIMFAAVKLLFMQKAFHHSHPAPTWFRKEETVAGQKRIQLTKRTVSSLWTIFHLVYIRTEKLDSQKKNPPLKFYTMWDKGQGRSNVGKIVEQHNLLSVIFWLCFISGHYPLYLGFPHFKWGFNACERC